MTGTLSPTATRPVDPNPLPTQGPRPGFWENFGASSRLAADDVPDADNKRRFDEYMPAIEAMTELNGNWRTAYIKGDWGRASIDEDRFWSDLAELRRTKPDALKGFPATREAFDQQYRGRIEARQATDQRIAARGGIVSSLAGGVVGTMTDPYNIASLPVSFGGKTVLSVAAREAAGNMLMEALETPLIQRERRETGRPEMSAGEAVVNVGLAGLGGAVLGGGFKAIELGAPKVAAPVRQRFERFVADNWDKLPEAVRTRWGSAAKVGDTALPELVEAVVGRANLSGEERAAIDVLRRDAEVSASSPFKPGPAGEAMHRQLIDDRLAAILQPVERQPYRAVVPTSRADLAGGTALTTGAPAVGAQATVIARIRHAESRGNDGAKNPLSSATGRYQFTAGTWLSYYKRRFGAQGLDDAQILAKRSDGRLQDVLMADLTADNAAFLRRAGEAETAGNLYLTHFAGQGGAGKLFRADPLARAVDVLGSDVGRANPWMGDMTVAELIRWAHRKMDELPPRRAGARAELDEAAVAADKVAAVQAEIDRIAAVEDEARAARDADAEARIAAALDADPVPIDVGEADVPVSTAPADRAADGLPDREAALVPTLRELIAGNDRLDIGKIATRLEATEAEVRRAMERIAATEKQLLVQRKDGSFRRAPSDRAPVDAFKFLSRAGGIADKEGHDLSEIFSVDAASSRTDALTGKRVQGARRQSVLVPGAGPLVRESGMPIDEAGERLFEAGYLTGADGGRPTVAETIAYLERDMAGRDARAALIPQDQLATLDRDLTDVALPGGLADMTEHMREWAHHNAPDLGGEDVDALARIMLRDDIANEDAALAELTHQAIVDALDDMRYESGDYDDALARYLDTVEPDSSSDRFAAEPRNAGEGAAGVEAGDDWWRAGESEGWDDPGGVAADAQTASVIHDIEAGEPDPDAGSEALSFYLDENGDARSWADVQAELDVTEAELNALRGCL